MGGSWQRDCERYARSKDVILQIHGYVFLTGCQRTTYGCEWSRCFLHHRTTRTSAKQKNYKTIGRVEFGISRGLPQYCRQSTPRDSLKPRFATNSRSSTRFRISHNFSISCCRSSGDNSQRNTEYCSDSPAPCRVL